MTSPDQSPTASGGDWAQELVDSLHIGAYRSTPDGRLLFVNPALAAMLGYDSAAELQARGVREEHYDPTTSRTSFIERIETAGLMRRQEACWKRRDGTDLWVRETARCVRDDSGRVACYEGFVEDITAEHAMWDALRDSEARFRGVFEDGPLACAVFDAQGRILRANRRFCDLLGYAERELRDLDALALTHASDRDRTAALAQELRAGTRDQIQVEKRYLRKDGSQCWCYTSVSAVRGADGQVANTIAMLQDLSEIRALEAQLAHAQKMEAVGRLAGGIAHDFNNLLTAVSGYAGLARRQLPTDAPVQNELREILDTVERGTALTRQLLAISRRQPVRPVVLDLAALVGDLRGLLGRLLGDDVQVEVECVDAPLLVEADPNQLEQVLLNLAVNARDAMPSGGTLTLSGRRAERLAADHSGEAPGAGPAVVLEVVDSGCGMDAQTQERMFEPFFTTKERGKGTGLGLSTTYGIVRQLGGTIEVQSTPGTGTTFRIWLPRAVATAGAAAAVPRPDSNHPEGSETLLVVEDEPALRRLLERVLTTSGYQVLLAASGAEALALFAAHSEAVDLVVTDVVMPGMGGPEMVAALEAAHRPVRAIFMSGYSDNPSLDARLRERDERLLQKPFSPGDLTQAVRAALDAGRPA